ncbi:MAG: RNA methyltransferase [Chloroflexota bacterium]|nr:RNA methyltransferase [Chloroflexota bacterium]
MTDRDTNPHRGWDELITSSTNPTIKLARSLHRKRVRQRERAILVEGTRSILTAHGHGLRIRALLVDASRASDVEVVVARLRGASGRVLLIDPALFQYITDTEHPQALVAICDMVDLELPVDSSFVVALDAVRDPGNLGTLIRSCAAAGADGVALLRGTVDPYNPKALRASVGSIFALPVQSFAGVDDIIRRCFLNRPLVVMADADGERAYEDVDWSAPTLLVIGGEADGTSDEARTYADIIVNIPMAPGVESLNAAVAGSIIAFEIARQRRLSR